MSDSATEVSDRRRVVEIALDRVQDWDLDGYLELFDEAAVMESPFAPAGFPAGRMEGVTTIRQQLGPLWTRARESGRAFVGYDPMNIYECSRSNVVVAEFQALGEVPTTGETFALRYVHVYTFSPGGKILQLRDYWNPAAVALAA